MPIERVTCITGMHRSGTSMVARIVNLLGVDLGPEDRLMAPKADNPAGFWEAASIAGFDDDLLAQLGGRWDDPTVLADGWELDPALDPWRERAAALLDEQFPGGGHVAWKDPRMSILLPFWRTVIAVDHVVLVHRGPADVAASLAARGDDLRTDPEQLWLRYVVAGLRAAPDATVVAYDRFFADHVPLVAALVAALDLPTPSDDVLAAIGSFVDATLRHRTEAGGAAGVAAAVDEGVMRGAPWVAPLAEELHRGWVAATAVDELASRCERLTADVVDLVDQRDRAVEVLERERTDLVDQRDRAVELLERERTDLVDQRDRAVLQMEAARAELAAERAARTS